jgi:hypothetical protein
VGLAEASHLPDWMTRRGIRSAEYEVLTKLGSRSLSPLRGARESLGFPGCERFATNQPGANFVSIAEYSENT